MSLLPDIPPALARSLEPPRTVYGLGGGDPMLAEALIERLASLVLVPGYEDFDSERIDLSLRSADDLEAAVFLAPFGSPRRMVIATHAEALRRKERQTDAAKLLSLILRLPAASCLVLLGVNDPDMRSHSKFVFGDKLDAAIHKKGVLVPLPPPSVEQLADWARRIAEKRGLRLRGKAALLLAEAAHGSRQMLLSEVEKVLLYCNGETEAGPEAVEAVRSRDPEDMIFRVVETAGLRETGDALRALDECLLFAENPHAVAGRLLALLGRQMRLLAQARELIDRGYMPRNVRSLPPEVAQLMLNEAPIASMAWKAADLFRAASRWEKDEIRAAFEALCETDLADKGGEEGSDDVTTNLKILLVRLGRAAQA